MIDSRYMVLGEQSDQLFASKADVEVYSRSTRTHLAWLTFDEEWNQWVLVPAADTIKFSSVCLQDIVSWLNELNLYA